ncbi:RNA-binding protein 39-like isoform X1 [Pyrus x bretschneideri]|uniref:RNA-binding protein 39-like isoform X1 n=2 Tax=Pyrus x bretschneideri TaxID=225117 RepID=UPI00202E5ECA|nr:RNA-binding protein 39-like isoform X1 [Pyrus x bretschneideri]
MDFDEYDYLEKTVQENDDRDSKQKTSKKGTEKSYRKREVGDHVSVGGEEDERKSSKRSKAEHENGREKDRHHRSGRERDRDSERDKDHDRDRERERDRERSSREKDRVKEKDKDKEREKERREREREKERERERRDRREREDRERREKEENERSRRSVSRSDREEKERPRRSSDREERERSRRSRSRSERDREREIRERDRELELRESRRFKDKKEAVEPEADPERDQRTVFAYQMPLKATERDVYEFFSKAGKVRDVRLIMDRNSRRSKGVGYIEFYDAMSVPMAIALSGQLLMGQPVMVKPSEAEKNLVQSNTSGAAGVVGPFGAVDRKLYVGNLHFNMTETHLREIFEPFGPVELVQLPLDLETGQCKGFGFVQFAHLEHAKAAQSLNGKLEIAGRTIKVSSVTDHVGSQDAGAKSADFDDDDGGGLSLNAQSRALLMQKLDRTGIATSIVGSLGVPALNGAAPNQLAVVLPINGQAAVSAPILPAAVAVNEPVGNPSECLLLKNMFDPATEREPDFDIDIKEDVEEECSKYGQVKHIYVDKNSAGFVYLRFETVEAAAGAQHAMHLRWFARRLISALFMQPQVYEAKFGA